ncbi:MAG: hypothetical protein JWM04_1798 [Verrucomicrobiales bacterium]|nr:hypothetical protein [Verrucomicrobiales bacterium]
MHPLLNPMRKISFSALLLSIGASLGAAEAIDPTLPKAPPDWKVELIAQTPKIQYPSVICTAPDGRVFVGQDPMDMPGPPDKPIDSVLCFHPDGHVTTFATNLYSVFGLSYLNGKLYIHHAPKFTVYDDNNGVGSNPVDLFETNPTPWGGTSLNDHIPSNMRLGMDGYFYMSVGDKGIYGAVGKDGSHAELHGGGVFRFKPSGTELEVYTSGTRNHLDLAINSEDEIFTYDNTDDGNGWWTRVSHLVDGGFYGYPFDYKPQRGYTLWRMEEYGGGSPTGATAYNEDALPAEYQGNLFMCEWGKRQLVRFVVERQGGSYKINSRQEFLTEGTTPFRPLGICVTPEGDGFYIADWNYGGWKNKAEAGRILKVTYTGAKNGQPRPGFYKDLAMGKKMDVSNEDLLTALGHTSQSVRITAERQIATQIKAGSNDKLIKRLRTLITNTKATSTARMSAIWALEQGTHQSTKGDAAFLTAATDKDPVVKRQAIRALNGKTDAATLKLLASLLDDSDPAIRFRATTALGHSAKAVPSATINKLVSNLEDPDFFARYSVFHTLNLIGKAQPDHWSQIVAGLKSSNSKVREGVLFAVRETYDPSLAKTLGDYVQDGNNPAGNRADALNILAELHHQQPAWDGKWWHTQPVKSPPPAKTVVWSGTDSVLSTLRKSLTDSAPEVRTAAIRGVELAGDSAAVVSLKEMLEKAGPDEKKAIIKALGSAGESARPVLATLLQTTTSTDVNLAEIYRSSAKVGGPELEKGLVEALNKSVDAPTKVILIESLGTMKAKSSSGLLASQLGDSDTKVASAAAAALGQIGGNDTSDQVLQFLETSSNPQAKRNAIAALGALKSKQAVPALLKAYSVADTRTAALDALAAIPDVRAVPVYLESMAEGRGGARGQIQRTFQSIQGEALPQVEAYLNKSPNPPAQLLTALQRIYATNDKAKKGPIFASTAKGADAKDYVNFATQRNGDATHGKVIFNDLSGVACLKCHKVYGTGAEIGPDLSSVGAKYNREQLIESVIYPSKLILDGYQQTIVFTKDNETVSGILRGETPEDLTLIDPEGKKNVVKKSQIDKRKVSELSLMPEGLNAILSLQDFADLVSYLETLKDKPAN